MHQIRYIMVGGFLGAGKTTTLARLAAIYRSEGLNVGIVTNDQAADLVDTNLLRSLGFSVGEVAGACFCCSFDDLMDTVRRLGEDGRPDIILAEPVGSCTDLVATVIQPIRSLFEAEIRVAPYAVILKPSHGRRILNNESGTGFSPKAAYILKKQIEEADAVLINRIDELSAEQADELERLVTDHVPDTPVFRISARRGDGFEALTEFLGRDGQFGHRILDIDYDIYADGEAELGWCNVSGAITSETEFELDGLLLQIIRELKARFADEEFEAAHLKAIGLWEGFFAVANLISSDTEPELSLPSDCRCRSCDLVVNARVAGDPEKLQQLVHEVVGHVVSQVGGVTEFRRSQSFRPGRPEPTHRFDSPVR